MTFGGRLLVAQTADLLATDVGCKERTKAVPPEPHGLVAKIDAAFEQQVLDVAQAQREPDVHHHYQSDHLGRGVEIAERTDGLGAAHARLLPARGSAYHPFDSATRADADAYIV